jgi:hypothetical protein
MLSSVKLSLQAGCETKMYIIFLISLLQQTCALVLLLVQEWLQAGCESRGRFDRQKTLSISSPIFIKPRAVLKDF